MRSEWHDSICDVLTTHLADAAVWKLWMRLRLDEEEDVPQVADSSIFGANWSLLVRTILIRSFGFCLIDGQICFGS